MGENEKTDVVIPISPMLELFSICLCDPFAFLTLSTDTIECSEICIFSTQLKVTNLKLLPKLHVMNFPIKKDLTKGGSWLEEKMADEENTIQRSVHTLRK